MPEQPPYLLLTGATGLVGKTLLELLSGEGFRRFALLTRAPQKLAELDGVEGFRVLRGDLTRPHLGLDDGTYAELKSTITEIIHCAADTRFGLPLESAQAVNTTGTQHIIELALECPKLQKFAHISTVYVVGKSSGSFPEDPIRHHNGFCNTYQQSKYEAEDLVERAMGGLPAAIFRLSSIVGDSATGYVRQFNYVHSLLRLFPQNVLPIAPGLPDVPVDLIAGDWAVAALAYLFESAFVPGRFYHLCAGSELSFTLAQMIEWTISVFENHPLGRKWLPIQVPELVCLARYEEFVEQRRLQNDRVFNELVRVLGYFLPHLAMFQSFENRETLRALAPSGLQFPCMRECFEKVVRYCLDTNWGR